MTAWLQPLMLGLVVLAAIYMVGIRVFGSQARRALGVFAGAIGFLTTLYMRENPAVMQEYTAEIVIAALGVVLAILAMMKK